MNEKGNDTVRQLIRLANDSSLDPQSRAAICAMAEHVRNLQAVSQQVREIGKELQQAGLVEKSGN